MPYVGLERHLEIRAALAEPVHDRMLGRDDKRAARPKDAEELGERGATVVGIVDGQRTDDAVKRTAWIRQGLPQDRSIHPRPAPNPGPGPNHPPPAPPQRPPPPPPAPAFPPLYTAPPH